MSAATDLALSRARLLAAATHADQARLLGTVSPGLRVELLDHAARVRELADDDADLERRANLYLAELRQQHRSTTP